MLYFWAKFSAILQYLKWIGYAVLLLIPLAVLLAYATGRGYLIYGLRQTYLRGYRTAKLDDYKFFSNRVIFAAAPQPWAQSENYNRYELPDDFRKYLEKYKTIAYLVVKGGKIEYEEYWDGYGDKRLSNSFSVAKTLVTLLLGKAIESGYIKGLDQKVGDFFPQFRRGLASELTVGDLSNMRTGLKWDENYYAPFTAMSKAYYDSGLDSLMLGLKVVEKPGQRFDYVSCATQLLAMVIRKASGQNLSSYLSENFWKPLGMNGDGLWSLDRAGGVEKAFCCVNTTARNLAKFGRLLLQKGSWNGSQLVDRSFVAQMIHPAAADSPQYGYGLWMDYQNNPPFYAMIGHGGQCVITIPTCDMVVVRLGFYRDDTPPKKHLENEVYKCVDGALQTLQSQF
ncbi:MAG: serine hydrolase [Flavobacteriales bacterium]